MLKKILFTIVAWGICHTVLAASRDSIHIVGSSTVFPFSKVVANRFATTTRFRGANVEATGTGGGFKVFCQGLGANQVDISNASRRIKKSEFERCVSRGVSEIVEVPIGYDGIVLVSSQRAKPLLLTPRDIFLALAKRVPAPNKEFSLIDNPYHLWSEVNPALPSQPIRVYGPPPSSGTRDSFVEMAIEAGCKSFPILAVLAKQTPVEYKRVCHVLRSGPEFVEAGEQDNVIIDLVSTNVGAVGIVGFNYLDQNRHRVQGAAVNGVAPTFENIDNHSYPISRPLYFYVKKAHVGRIPGLKEFLLEFTRERAWGDEGYLSVKGLVPLEAPLRAEIRERVKQLTPLDAKTIFNTKKL